MSVVVINIVEL